MTGWPWSSELLTLDGRPTALLYAYAATDTNLDDPEGVRHVDAD